VESGKKEEKKRFLDLNPEPLLLSVLLSCKKPEKIINERFGEGFV